MANDFDYLHIKGRTEGSSNELSLDVLDAARSNLDNKKKRRGSKRDKSPKLPRAPRGKRQSKHEKTASKQASSRTGRPSALGGHGGSGSSTLANAPEVARRKRVRRTSTLRRWVIGIAVLAAIVGLSTFAGFRYYQQRVDFNGHFTALVDEVVEIDQTLVNVDILMKDPFEADADALAKLLNDLPSLRTHLQQVASEAEGMMEERGDDDLAALNEVIDAAEAREDMLEPAEDALKLAQQTSKQVAQANAAWNKVLDADQTARSAASMANSASTEEQTIAARDETNEAIDQMNEALLALEDLEATNKGLDLSSQKTYLKTRVKALGYAVQTSDALLANDRQAATTANDSYNAAEREAAAQVSKLPVSLGDEVEKLYQDEMDDCIDRYQQVRSRVTEVDSTLRTRLS